VMRCLYRGLLAVTECQEEAATESHSAAPGEKWNGAPGRETKNANLDCRKTHNLFRPRSWLCPNSSPCSRSQQTLCKESPHPTAAFSFPLSLIHTRPRGNSNVPLRSISLTMRHFYALLSLLLLGGLRVCLTTAMFRRRLPERPLPALKTPQWEPG